MPKKVRFLADHRVDDAEGKVFAKGKTYTMNDASVWHFVRRNLAEVVEAKKASK